jgi:hypothetical protein
VRLLYPTGRIPAVTPLTIIKGDAISPQAKNYRPPSVPGYTVVSPREPERAQDFCSGRNAARTSVANRSGSSQAGKWPPLSTSLKYVRLG